ncbi:MAG: AsmA family protein [Nitrosomonadales bacterium]|nr:AsmA family protein [Nitrosomonadales bacterium]
MNKILKYGLIGTGAVIGIVVAGVAYIAVTFNPNDYKPRIIQAVKDSNQRNLHLDGDIKLSLYPNIGVNLNKVSLSEFKSDKEFVAIETARVSVALMPLLRKQVIVDEVAVSGLKAALVKHKDGTTNIDDLLGKDEKKKDGKQPVMFDIASVSLEKTNIFYRDEGAGAQYAIKDLNLKTGRIANGVSSKIDLSVSVQANQPKLNIATQVKTTLTFDLEKQRYRFEGLDLQASGAAMDIGNLKLKAGGDASADLNTQEFGAKKFKLNATGAKAKDNFDVVLDAPSLSLTKDKFSGDKLTLNARLDGVSGNIAAALSLPGLEGNAQSFKSSAFTLDLDVKQPEQSFKVKLSSPLSGNFQAQQFNLSNLAVSINATGDKLPNKSVSSEMKGSVQVDALKQNVRASLAGGLLQSQVKAKVGVNGFTNPAIQFDVDVDQFDADLYLPKKPADTAKSGSAQPRSAQPRSAQPGPPEQPLDLSALRKLNLDGSLRIGSLKVSDVKLSQLRLDMKAHNGLLDINPLSANLYQGSFNGSVGVNAQQATPSFTISESLNNIDIGALLKSAVNLDTVEGKGSISLNLSTHGNTVSALKKAVYGKVALNVTNGVFKQSGKSYAGEVKGDVQIDGSRQSMLANLSGKMQQSKFAAKLALYDFNDPDIRFDVDVDQLDADQYLPKPAPSDAKKPSAPEEPLDLSALKKLNAEGGLRIGSLKVFNMRLAQVRLDMKARKGVVSVNPLSANLYQGSMNGSLGVNAQATPSFAINQNLNGVNVAALTRDAANFDTLEGKGNVGLNLTMQGNTVSAMKKALNGNMSLNLADGAVKGINVAKKLREAQALFGKGGASAQTQSANNFEKTDFSEFKATFKVSNGVAHNDDLFMKSPLLRLAGAGDINIGNDSVNYLAKATLAKTLEGQGGKDNVGGITVPVRVSGPFTDLKYTLDFGSMVSEAVKQEVKTRLQDQLKGKLKGLFK